MIAPPKPPSHDDLEALIKEARARQLRRRLLGAAAVAIAAALGLGIYAITLNSGTGSTTGNSPSRPAGAPLCRSTQLAAAADFNHSGGRPTIFGGVMIANTSSSKCSLPHNRPAAFLNAARRQVPLRQFPMPALVKNPSLGGPVPLMTPRAFAEIYVLWANWCAQPATALTLRFGNG